jgi:hypothetical protein
MSHKRRSTNTERRAKAKQKLEDRKRDEWREECRMLEGELHRAWRERDENDPMSESDKRRDNG